MFFSSLYLFCFRFGFRYIIIINVFNLLLQCVWSHCMCAVSNFTLLDLTFSSQQLLHSIMSICYVYVLFHLSAPSFIPFIQTNAYQRCGDSSTIYICCVYYWYWTANYFQELIVCTVTMMIFFNHQTSKSSIIEEKLLFWANAKNSLAI